MSLRTGRGGGLSVCPGSPAGRARFLSAECSHRTRTRTRTRSRPRRRRSANTTTRQAEEEAAALITRSSDDDSSLRSILPLSLPLLHSKAPREHGETCARAHLCVVPTLQAQQHPLLHLVSSANPAPCLLPSPSHSSRSRHRTRNAHPRRRQIEREHPPAGERPDGAGLPPADARGPAPSRRRRRRRRRGQGVVELHAGCCRRSGQGQRVELRVEGVEAGLGGGGVEGLGLRERGPQTVSRTEGRPQERGRRERGAQSRRWRRAAARERAARGGRRALGGRRARGRARTRRSSSGRRGGLRGG